ncbi:DUF3887 domain-containing protein [Mycolicibacterium sp. Dal123E01]|uniref:DUF3887 domain-containing protein n=1 Tax=Mycolicibacterium sp. Dal123E01 TaxID=3457578 RepID=UPI00403E8431
MDPLEAVAAAVRQAREAGYSWHEIREVLGNPSPLPEAGDLARVVIDDLAHARWADVSARFDATMRDQLTNEDLAQGWAQVAGSAGAYRSHGDTGAVRTGEFTTTNTPLSFESGEFVARIAFRDDQTIAGLYILNPDAAARS